MQLGEKLFTLLLGGQGKNGKRVREGGEGEGERKSKSGIIFRLWHWRNYSLFQYVLLPLSDLHLFLESLVDAGKLIAFPTV